ncbi:hypothetical protein RFI_08250 [Reticulomyxa filosa]|uniref:Cullin family profile domain-containing protein n=1 Tax=Reticulomyxa filosa TaxID=46433 RepID=X6NUF8_RETFI|nr:hypothetical protein RFI_08250 [Reticulomyxa filosa]|eukprot:ETO28877.1 hypothetical protein RFI_08250 [Reticulomyxa filosa]
MINKDYQKKKCFVRTEQPKLDANFEKDTVTKLIEAVEAVFEKKAANCSFEELYKACQSLCTLKKGKQVYDGLYEVCDKHIKKSIEKYIDTSISHSQSYLEPFKNIWMRHCEEMNAIRQIFLLLDKTYVKTSTDMKSLWNMGIHLLKKHILAKENACSNLVVHLLQLIENERNGEQIDQDLLKPIIQMASTKYYENEGNNFVATMSIPDYLLHVRKRLKEEEKRVKNYLEAQTQRPITLLIEHEMIKKHVEDLLTKGFDSMMDESKFANLRHLYELLFSVQEVDALQQHFSEYGKKRGVDIISDPSLDAQNEMVASLLKFKAKLDRVVNESFHNHRTFHHTIRNSWEYFLNIKPDKPAELIAKVSFEIFFDKAIIPICIYHQLRTGARGTSEQELEESLDRVMDIFRFIHAKDVFQAFYKKDLAKVLFEEYTRLLLNTSASEDAEKNMINRIRKECGQSFASNLENMFQDMGLSRDLQGKFKTHLENSNPSLFEQMSKIDFQIDVLTTGCWPTYDTEPIDLPPQVQSVLDSYRTFYCDINSGRQLKWTISLSHCVVAAHFPKVLCFLFFLRQYDALSCLKIGKKGARGICISRSCAIAVQPKDLLAIQRNRKCYQNQGTKEKKMCYILYMMKLETDELKRTMLSLVKSKILLHRVCAKDSKETEYKLNAAYTNRFIRVKVNQLQIVETKEEHRCTSEKIFHDRQYQVFLIFFFFAKKR